MEQPPLETPPATTSPTPAPTEAGPVDSRVTDALWRRGELRWKLHAEQLALYVLMLACTASRFVLEIARRFGKTWLLVVIASETALRNPGGRIVYGAPTLKHLEEFVIPTFEAIVADAPPECRPWFNAKRNRWCFPNGAHVQLFGADDKRKANRGRGSGSILNIFDEAGFTPVLKYVLRSVLRPQLFHAKKRLNSFVGMTLLASTPAEEPDHDFTQIAERAESRGNHARRTLYQNPRKTPADIERDLKEDAEEEGMSVEEYKLSDDFRREWLAQRVANKLLIVMGRDWELSKEKCFKLYEENERPLFFDGMTTLDFGGVDPHAGLFGCWDFPKAMLRVDEELLLRDGENTDELQAAVKEVERALWGTDLWNGTLRAMQDEALLDALPDWVRERTVDKTPKQPYIRWCDNNIQLAKDLYELHRLLVLPTAKDNKELAINNVKVLMRAGQLAINPKLAGLVRHLETTIWKNDRRREYRRRNGEHGDLLDCLTYKVRNINRNRNPFPADWKNAPVEVARHVEAKRKEREKLAAALMGDSPLARRLRSKMG